MDTEGHLLKRAKTARKQAVSEFDVVVVESKLVEVCCWLLDSIQTLVHTKTNEEAKTPVPLIPLLLVQHDAEQAAVVVGCRLHWP